MLIVSRFLDVMFMLTPLLCASNVNLAMFAVPAVQVKPAIAEVARELVARLLPAVGEVARFDEGLTACIWNANCEVEVIMGLLLFFLQAAKDITANNIVA